MSRWFRHYAGMMRDDKLVRAALKAKQSIERTVWVWGAILESASEIDDEGRYEIDCDEIAHFLRCKPAHIEAIVDSLKNLGRITDDHVTTWAKRQFKSDRSKDRVTEYRARKRAERNADVTLQERHGNAPETETETEITEDKSSDASASSDKAFWENSKAYLGKSKAGMIGKWVRDHGKDATARAITSAQIERAVEPVPYIEKALRNGAQAKASAPAVPI